MMHSGRLSVAKLGKTPGTRLLNFCPALCLIGLVVGPLTLNCGCYRAASGAHYQIPILQYHVVRTTADEWHGIRR